jgi:predicted DNA-binding transcriptional regulator AlpA
MGKNNRVKSRDKVQIVSEVIAPVPPMDVLLDQGKHAESTNVVRNENSNVALAKTSNVVLGSSPNVESSPESREPSLLLTVSDLCGLLRVSRTTLNRIEKIEEIPGKIKLGGNIRYHRETIENWLRSRV